MIPAGLLIFFFILRKSGAAFPIAEGQSTDPFFFGGLFSVLIPLIIYVYIGKVFRGIVLKRSAKEIAVDVAKDVALTAATTVAMAALDSGSGDRNASSGSGGTKGGGGDFGGGGASGGY